jgi:WD40 repeat protein
MPPFTPGALRGGSHVHVWNPEGTLVSFTYEDQVLGSLPPGDHDGNQRNIGVSVLNRPISVPATHPRNHDGNAFTVLVSRTTANLQPGSDEMGKAFEEAWIGTRGYLRPDGTRQAHALACQGHVRTESGETISEVFRIDLPADLTQTGVGPLEGTETRRPSPPQGTSQHRLTFTANDPFPGIQGPRHWLRSSPDGSQIGFLKKDHSGVVQFWVVSPNGGPPTQVTHNPHPVASAFTWHPDGRRVAFAMDGSICLTDVFSGTTTRLTPRSDPAPRPEACVISPNGQHIAFVRHLDGSNQICIVSAPE